MTEIICFPQEFEAMSLEYPGLTLCRVVTQEKGFYYLISSSGEYQASVSGRFRYEAVVPSDYPAVGDYVMADISSSTTAIIHNILPRRSVFRRKAAGTAKNEQIVAVNIDTLFLCMALNSDFNLRRLERYLTVAWDSGAMPVVVLTKSDLCGESEDKAEKIAAAERVAIGADVLVTTSFDEDGLSPVYKYIEQGKTVTFVGSSGVGKSTMINRLLEEERLDTNGLRNDGKGRHTTTHRELLFLSGGAMVIDTPGMRELGMWDAAEGLSTAFADIEDIAAGCRFNDCTHGSEPGCAVRAAINSGQLSEERFRSYQKLIAENAYMEDTEDYFAAKEKKFKSIAKYNKTNRKR